MTMQRTHLIARYATLTIAVLSLVACNASTGLGTIGGFDWNVTDEPARWSGYQQDRIYEIQSQVFLLDVPERTNGLALIPGMESDVPPSTFRGPTSIEEYQANPRRFRWVNGVVEPGTLLRVTQLRSKGNLRAPKKTRVYVKAQFMRGPHQGKLVDLESVSIYAIDVETGRDDLIGPNENFLTRVHPGAQ